MVLYTSTNSIPWNPRCGLLKIVCASQVAITPILYFYLTFKYVSMKLYTSVDKMINNMLLLPSRFSRVRLCATPQTAAHQAPPSPGFSRQEPWSGLPFPSPMHESEKWKWSRSVMSDSQRPHGLQPTRLLCPWDSPGRSSGVGCHGWH